ncbi:MULTISPECIES: hypothetical protein [Methylobacterium]|jgi:hypothetical protein|uniref:Uncharacterized protein n=2 Tax=Methylobacterium TaxID=407 RepID=A0A2R4WM28_9HYPH|nr:MULTISPECIES: hypothetical protein [Methylobacterium]MBZ6411039.1 hypothetical protein [Methylobacterium sp.]AWB22607.1 hypothetical protein DA075_18220 [Methylobacterium currus]MBK3397170.1 hypothetical protein [Methylobacterium ajmalii]MBK3408384.1 hypothetical protein [Methylobacterium ajmalii]MBK3422593.1 hypothetical protein [Methylobacterium ajmalii]
MVVHDQGCPYMRQLHEMLTDGPLSVTPALADALLDRLIAFEAEAKGAGAPANTLNAISNARFTAGVATLRPWFPMPRGH